MRAGWRWSALTWSMILLASIQAAPAVSAGDPIPLKIVRGIWIVIPVRINGSGPYDFLLDSGTNTTIIHTGFARSLGLAATDRIELVTLAGAEVVPRSFLAEVSAGSATAAGVEALWSEMREVHALDPRIVGVLGTSFLSRFNYLIDYRARRIEFETASEIGERIGGRRVQIEQRQGRAIVAAEIGGQWRDLVIDPGAAEIVLFARAGRRGLKSLQRIGESALAATDAGRVRLEMAILPGLRIGDREWRDLRVLLARDDAGRDVDGLLPMRLFSSIYINHREGYVVIGEEAMGGDRSANCQFAAEYAGSSVDFNKLLPSAAAN